MAQSLMSVAPGGSALANRTDVVFMNTLATGAAGPSRRPPPAWTPSWAASPGAWERPGANGSPGHDVPLGLAMTPWRAHPRVMLDE
jgi:hypothetical protein